jgi:hypothetical protein
MNYVWNGEIYNPTYKDDFLNRFLSGKKSRISTYKTYERVFKASYSAETYLEKDLMYFDEQELIEFIKVFLNPKSSISARTYGFIVKCYIDHCSNHIDKSVVNPFGDYTNHMFDEFKQEVDDSPFFSEDTLEDMEDSYELVNAQDSVVLRLLFEGVQGDEVYELINLTKYDVNRLYADGKLRGELLLWTKLLEEREQGDRPFRKIEVSERALKIIGQAYGQRDYEKNNGYTVFFANNVQPTIKLERNSAYIVRPSITRSEVDREPFVDKAVIYRRMATLKKALGFTHLTTKNIVKSGMIAMARDLVILKNKWYLEKEDFVQICDKFGFKRENYWFLKNYVNLSNIKELYGDKPELMKNANKYIEKDTFGVFNTFDSENAKKYQMFGLGEINEDRYFEVI